MGSIISTSPASLADIGLVILDSPDPLHHAGEVHVIFISAAQSPIEFHELLLGDIVLSLIPVESVVVDFKNFQEIINGSLFRLLAIAYIRMLLGIVKVPHLAVEHLASSRDVKLAKCLFNCLSPDRTHLTQDHLHELFLLKQTISVAIETVEDSIDVFFF